MLTSHPSREVAPRIACRLCLEDKHWTSYQNSESGGIVTNLCRHLLNKHLLEYNGNLKVLELEYEKREGKRRADSSVPPFSWEGFNERLMKLVVVDDEVHLFVYEVINTALTRYSRLIWLKHWSSSISSHSQVKVLELLLRKSPVQRRCLKLLQEDTNSNMKHLGTK